MLPIRRLGPGGFPDNEDIWQMVSAGFGITAFTGARFGTVLAQPSVMKGHPMSDSAPMLSTSAIHLGAHAEDWRSAIRLAGAALVAGGVTTEDYTQEMIDTVESLGPYIVVAPGFALAHSRTSPSVLTTGLSWVSLDTPVEFGSKTNDPVDLVVGLAALDHEAHIGIMSKLAGVLADPEMLARLRASTDPEEVLSALTTG